MPGPAIIIRKSDKTIKEILSGFVHVDSNDLGDIRTLNQDFVLNRGVGYFGEDQIKYLMITSADNTPKVVGMAELTWNADGTLKDSKITNIGAGYPKPNAIIIDLPVPPGAVQATAVPGSGYTITNYLSLPTEYEIVAESPSPGDIPGRVGILWENPSGTATGAQIKLDPSKFFKGKFASGATFADINVGSPQNYVSAAVIKTAGAGYTDAERVPLLAITILGDNGAAGLSGNTFDINVTWGSNGEVTAISFADTERTGYDVPAGDYDISIPAPDHGTQAVITVTVTAGAQAKITLAEVAGVAAQVRYTMKNSAILPKIVYDDGSGVLKKHTLNSIGVKQRVLDQLGTDHEENLYGHHTVTEDFES